MLCLLFACAKSHLSLCYLIVCSCTQPSLASAPSEMAIDDTALRMAVPQDSIKGGDGSEDWGAAERT